MTPVRLEPPAPRSRVKHSTTEPLRSLLQGLMYTVNSGTLARVSFLRIMFKDMFAMLKIYDWSMWFTYISKWQTEFAMVLLSQNFAPTKYHENKTLEKISEFAEFKFSSVANNWRTWSRIEKGLSYKNLYSKTCLKWPLSKSFQDRLLLNASQKYCRLLQGEHSAILSTFIKLPFVNSTLL